jgi:hypothetical protein
MCRLIGSSQWRIEGYNNKPEHQGDCREQACGTEAGDGLGRAPNTRLRSLSAVCDEDETGDYQDKACGAAGCQAFMKDCDACDSNKNEAQCNVRDRADPAEHSAR